MEEIVITPDWPNMIRWHGNALATHSFDCGARSPIRAFMETVRYLALTEPDELEKIMEEFVDPMVVVEDDELGT